MDKEYLHEGAIGNDTLLNILNNYDFIEHVGGQASFFGRVRGDIIEGKRVKEIDYSAYKTMVNKEFAAIEKVFLTDYKDIQTIKILHAIGNVKVGEIALVVVVSAGHRKQAFTAIPEIVNAIKERIPIWKKEIFEDGEYIWTENFQIK